MLLVALLLLALAAGLLWTPRGQVALADLLLQATTTNTPDPNSPLATPTPTWTPFPTDTPTTVVTPSDTPAAPPTDTPVVFPTDTPVVFPTDTPFVLPTDTPFVLPTNTPLAPIDAPMPPTLAPEPILPPPAPPPTSDQPITVPLDVILVIPPPAEEAAPVDEETDQRRLDPALFIDNLVIAFGYVWMCFGGLAIIGAALGGFWLWRRRSRPPAQAVPDPGQPAAQPPMTMPVQPPPSAPPPAPTRVAARRRSSPPHDLD
jgi:hypothetical protein